MAACAVVLVAGGSAAAAGVRNPTRHYPLLYRVGSVAVFGPKGRMPSGYCPPRPLPLSREGLRTAARLMRAGLGALGRPRRPLVDVRGATVRAAFATTSRRGALASIECSRLVRRRTVVVTVRYPRVRSASLSYDVVFMSHVRDGWEIWDVVH